MIIYRPPLERINLHRMQLNYLTVQDILWLHLQITGEVQSFDFATLEEATFYQYAYGKSADVLAQSARFATGFEKLTPFSTANRAVNFAATVAFLEANHKHFSLADDKAKKWFEGCQPAATKGAISAAVSEVEAHGHEPAMRDVLKSVLERFPKTIGSLAKS
jgi:prophage maintenance system killer protein